MPVKSKIAKYKITLPAESFEDQIRVLNCAGPEEIERTLTEHWSVRLSEHRCPACRTRLAFVGDFAGTLPEHKQTLLVCRNEGCTAPDDLYLIEGTGVRTLAKKEYYRMLDERRRQIQAALKSGKMKMREVF